MITFIVNVIDLGQRVYRDALPMYKLPSLPNLKGSDRFDIHEFLNVSGAIKMAFAAMNPLRVDDTQAILIIIGKDESIEIDDIFEKYPINTGGIFKNLKIFNLPIEQSRSLFSDVFDKNIFDYLNVHTGFKRFDYE